MSRAVYEAYALSKLAAFAPWRAGDRCPQAEFLAACTSHRVRIFRAGNRSTKTTVGAVDTLLLALGWHPAAFAPPPLRIWVSALDWKHGIGEIVWPAMQPWLPSGQVRAVNWLRRSEPAIPEAITFRNGSLIEFKTADSGADKFQGARIDFAWLDEEHPEDVGEEVRARLIDRAGRLSLTFTPLKRLRWLQRVEREPGTLTVRASMREVAAAGILPQADVDAYLASLPERQRRVRELGDYVALQGAVFPEFDRDRHVARAVGGQLRVGDRAVAPWPIPSDWPRLAAVDWGFSVPCAWVLAAEDPFTGRLIVERVWCADQIRASRWAQLMLERLPRSSLPAVSDWDASERAECNAAGLRTVAAVKDVQPGLEALGRRLATDAPDGLPLLLLAEDPTLVDPELGRCDAARLVWEVEGYRYPAQAKEGKADARDQPVKKDDHALDGTRYLVMARDRGRRSSCGLPDLPGSAPRGYDPGVTPSRLPW